MLKSAVLLLSLLFVAEIANGRAYQPSRCKKKRNVIFMVSDGFGTASMTLTREYLMKKSNQEFNFDYELPLDKYLVGAVRTRSSDSWVTDSAGAATAYACGVKTVNHAIGVDDKNVPCATMLEAAKALGYTTGLVVTSRVTHATPAGWSAHAVERDDEELIAAQQIGDYTLGRQVDLMVGGGRGFFLPAGDPGSKRKDTRNLIQEATTKYGWKTYVENATQWRSVAEDSSSLPLLSLLHNSHMNYEIDRDDKVEPSLAETVKKSLKILKHASERCDSPGFFVMIEGSRLDHAAHSNDVATHVVENVAYQAAVKEVEAFVQHNPDTLALSTSDHETGGATVARQVNMSNPNIEYRWNPEAIFPVKASVEIIAPLIRSEKSDLPNFVKKIVKEKMGLDITQTEVNAVIEARRLDVEVFKKDSYFTEWQLSELVNTRAEVGWTTHGHTGVDVNLYAIGPHASYLAGHHDNTQLSHKVMEWMGIQSNLIQSLKEKIKSTQITVRKGKRRTRRSVEHEAKHKRWVASEYLGH